MEQKRIATVNKLLKSLTYRRSVTATPEDYDRLIEILTDYSRGVLTDSPCVDCQDDDCMDLCAEAERWNYLMEEFNDIEEEEEDI